MAGVTSAGFVAKTYQEIFNEIAEYLQQNLGIDINSDPDSVAKLIVNILSLSDSQNWSAAEAIPTMFDIDQATGEWLENLCKLRLISRRQGTYASGYVDILAKGVADIPAGTLFSDTDGNSFASTVDVLVSVLNTKKVKVLLPSLKVAGDVISIELNGELVSVTLTVDNLVGDAWIAELITNLDQAGYTGTQIALAELEIVAKTGEHFKVENLTKLFVVNFVTQVDVVYDKLGPYSFPANTVTKGATYSNIIYITNPLSISGGSFDETDDELRYRFKTSLSVGKATAKAIKSAILAVDGVTSVTVLENDTDTLNTEFNIPAHGVLVTVVGGSDLAVGQALYDTKAASVGTAGNTTVIVKDSSDNDEAVQFQRVTDKYIHVRYTYSLYDEEIFPEDGVDVVKQLITDYINGLGVGEDVIQGRVMGQVYSGVKGVGYSKVEIATTPDFNDTPTTWSDVTPIAVSLTEAAFTATSKITLVEV